MPTTHYTQQELCDAIYSVVKEAKKPLSRLDIVRAIGRKKSPHIVNMIEHLTTSGYFIRRMEQTKFGTPVLVYELTEKSEPDCEAESRA